MTTPSTPLELNFCTALPVGWRKFTTVEVAGTFARIEDAVAFARGSEQRLELEPEPDNKYDPNAIKVIGIWKGWFTHRAHIGYLPADNAKLLAKKGMVGQIMPSLIRIWHGGYEKDAVYVRLDLLTILPEELPERRKSRKKN